jgi:hypothetical protein
MSMAIANLLNAEELEPRAHVQTAPCTAHDASNGLASLPPLSSDEAQPSPLVSPTAQSADLGDVAAPNVDESMPGTPPSSPPAAARAGASFRNDIRGRKGKMSEQKRKQALAADELVLVLNAHRVRCRKCQSELQLSRKSKYDLAHWLKHRERCVGKGGQPKKGRRLSKAKLSTPPRSRFSTPESTPPFGHSATASNASTPDPTEADLSAPSSAVDVDVDNGSEADDRQEDDTYFSAQQCCPDVSPPRVRASDPDFADAPVRYQLRIAYAQRHVPPRASDWDYSCLRRGPWAFSPVPGADDGSWLPVSTGEAVGREASAPNAHVRRFCPY